MFPYTVTKKKTCTDHAEIGWLSPVELENTHHIIIRNCPQTSLTVKKNIFFRQSNSWLLTAVLIHTINTWDKNNHLSVGECCQFFNVYKHRSLMNDYFKDFYVK